MSKSTVLYPSEDAPHIELNQDGSSIDLSNWDEPANRNWSYRNILDVFPYTQRIDRGVGPVHELNPRPVDISSVGVNYRNLRMLLEEFLYESHCDAMVVVQGNNLVYENYRRMQDSERHLCQSISKTSVCAILSGLVEQGLIDSEATVDHYFPDVASGFAGIRLQDLMDMNVALDFSEDFTDPEATVFEYEMITAWHPERAGQAEGLLPYLKRMEHDPELHLDGVTNYFCPNADMLGCIIERVTGLRFTELFQQNIYRHIGAEADAMFSTDARGKAVCSGGLIIRPKDLARYGQLYANKGIANDGARVLSESWVADCMDTSKGTQYYLGEDYRYHNQMTSNGKAFCHLGLGGQMLYANTETGVVVVQFSTLSSLSNGDLDVGNALYNIADAISDFLA